MSLLGKSMGEGKSIKLPQTPVMTQGEISVGTPLGELVDRKDLADLHSSVGVKDDRKPRRRSIGEGLG
jgi:hypothetical protein